MSQTARPAFLYRELPARPQRIAHHTFAAASPAPRAACPTRDASSWLRLFRRAPAPSLFQRCLAVHIARASETRWRAADPPRD